MFIMSGEMGLLRSLTLTWICCLKRSSISDSFSPGIRGTRYLTRTGSPFLSARGFPSLSTSSVSISPVR